METGQAAVWLWGRIALDSPAGPGEANPEKRRGGRPSLVNDAHGTESLGQIRHGVARIRCDRLEP